MGRSKLIHFMRLVVAIGCIFTGKWGSGKQGRTFQMHGSGRDARYASKSSSLAVGASATAARLTYRRHIVLSLTSSG